jgi:Tol biopolymer transport system component
MAAVLTALSFVAPAQATFPGANGKFAFDRTVDGNSDVYVMEPDGSNVTRLTTDPAADVNPGWSADGTKIAFTSNRAGNNEIYVMNADGSGQTNLTQHPRSDHEL